METGQAQRFVAAFASFGIFAAAYFQLGDAIKLSPDYSLPASMHDTIEVLIVLFFVSSNMIMLLRSMTVRDVAENRTILVALALMASALLMMFAAKVIDSRYVLEFAVTDGDTRNFVIIRPLNLSDEANGLFGLDVPADLTDAEIAGHPCEAALRQQSDCPNFVENRAILADLASTYLSKPGRLDSLVVDNGAMVFVYALLIALSKALLLFSFSLLTWAAVLLAQRARAPDQNAVAITS